MVYSLAEIEKKFTTVADKYGIGKAFVFGSYGRGDANENSDVDFYISDTGDVYSFFQMGQLIEDLEKIFQCHVDVISGEVKDKIFYHNIIKDGKVIYENKQKSHSHYKNERVLRPSIGDSRILRKRQKAI